jgi:DNA-binding NarL/FixJ family response regulator
VLIVDDNAEFCRFASRLLEAEGYEVVGVAEDGERAFAASDELAPEVVLLDVNLPDASGFDLAARFASERPETAVLLTSTRGGAELEQLALSCGARGYVPKDQLSGAELDRRLR